MAAMGMFRRATAVWAACLVPTRTSSEEQLPQKDLQVRVLAEGFYLESSDSKSDLPDVRFPWPIRDVDKEVESAKQAGATVLTSRGLELRDGLEFLIEASAAAAPADVPVGVFVGLFSMSHTSSYARVEEWMAAGNLPPRHNPIRLSTMFTHQYHENGGQVQADDLGDACLGEAFRAEFCARVSTCFLVQGRPERGGGAWRVASPVRFAAHYRLEVYIGTPSPNCRTYLTPEVQAVQPPITWWAPQVADHTVPSQSAMARYAAYTEIRLLYVNRENFWWGKQAQVSPTSCWMDMMQASVNTAGESIAARPERFGLQPSGASPHGLWLEFGVGSGKTTMAIALQMKALLGEAATLHGFDSFEGIPFDWDYTHLAAGTFSQGGKIPEHLHNLTNVEIHVGLFNSTLGDLDRFGAAPIALAHVDVDIFPSAIEVLSRIACQLYPGSVVVFDELVNYVGFEFSGEYRAWEFIAKDYQIGWEYAGIYWQQAVPVVITERGRIC